MERLRHPRRSSHLHWRHFLEAIALRATHNSIRTLDAELVLNSTIFEDLVPSGGPGEGRDRGDVQLEKPPVPLDDFERNALTILADIEANQRYLNVPEHDGRLLRILTQTMGAKHVVEPGTSTGISGIYRSRN